MFVPFTLSVVVIIVTESKETVGIAQTLGSPAVRVTQSNHIDISLQDRYKPADLYIIIIHQSITGAEDKQTHVILFGKLTFSAGLVGICSGLVPLVTHLLAACTSA